MVLLVRPTDVISSMTEKDQITLSVAQLEANSNIANVNVVSSDQEPMVDCVR